MEDKNEDLLVFNSWIAKKMVQRGFTVIDVRKDYKTKNASIIVFKKNDTSMKAFLEIVEEEKSQRRVS